ncbi:hypothetical protein DFH07DRAFT_972068 [Mycena maculata]|uniref:feruloyl esterase n=1 Tax=Mycena maculata TaxID=230809 RepID=A0AAD7HJL5_9AGAR|nr:hypothetical protein DFH07DRAFT_972068 [Mycena maculata]
MLPKHALQLLFLSPILVLSARGAGCGSATPWTFDGSNHANQTVGNRTFLVHIPAAYNATTAHPVVLSFHGYGEDAQIQENITGFSKKGISIDGTGIIAVYPLAAYGPGKHHKPARAWTGAPYSPPNVDDFQFVDALLDSLQTNLCVDPKRIYASGMSNGGGFVSVLPIFHHPIPKAAHRQVNLLACSADMAAKFAAFAPVSAALYSGTHPFAACSPGRAIPLINFHGTADKTIPYDGRNSSNIADNTPPIPQWREAWAVRNGCDASAPSNVSRPYDGVVETTWACGAGSNATAVKAFEIEGGIHRWPSLAETTFDATPEQIIPFFSQHILAQN